MTIEERLARIHEILTTRQVTVGANLCQLPVEYPPVTDQPSPRVVLAQYIVELEEHLRWLTENDCVLLALLGYVRRNSALRQQLEEAGIQPRDGFTL